MSGHRNRDMYDWTPAERREHSIKVSWFTFGLVCGMALMGLLANLLG